MIRVCFQNGPEGPEIMLTGSFESDPSTAELKALAVLYGTVEGAAAWVEGAKKPKHLEVDEAAAFAAVPDDSVLKEHVPSAPPAPEVTAKEEKARAKLEAEHQAARDAAAEENAQAHADAAAEAEAAAADAEVAPVEPEPAPEPDAAKKPDKK